MSSNVNVRSDDYPLTPEQVTDLTKGLRSRGDVYKLPNRDLARLMKDPAGLVAIQAALAATPANPVQTPEEIAAKEQAAKEAADKAAADAASAEAARVAAEEAAKKASETAPKPWEAEDASWKAQGVIISRDAEGKIIKIAEDYQIKDESGNALGRPTHIEAKDWYEWKQKKDECHIQATRAFSRLKAQKVSFKNQQEPQPVKELTEQEYLALIEDVKGKDSAKAVAAIRKIAGSEVAKERQQAQEAIAKAEGQRIAYSFMKKHTHDFNPCQANSDIIGKYLEENNLEFTEDNLEIALLAKEKELAPVIEPARPTPPADNPTVTASPEALKKRVVTITKGEAYPEPQPGETLIIIERESVVATPPVAPAAPASPAAPANPPLPASRPGVNGGIVPETMSAPRPTTATGKLTKADIIAMSKKDPAKFRRLVADPQSRLEMNAILAGKA